MHHFHSFKVQVSSNLTPPRLQTKIDSDAVFQFLYFVNFLFFSNLYFVKFFDINTFSLSRKKREWDREKERERDGFIYCDIFCQVFRHQDCLPLSRLHTIWSQTPVSHESCFCVHCVLTWTVQGGPPFWNERRKTNCWTFTTQQLKTVSSAGAENRNRYRSKTVYSAVKARKVRLWQFSFKKETPPCTVETVCEREVRYRKYRYFGL